MFSVCSHRGGGGRVPWQVRTGGGTLTRSDGDTPARSGWGVPVQVSHAVYTLIQCTPLLLEKAGVAPVVTFRITAHKQERVQARYPLWI